MGKRWIPLEANPDVMNQVIFHRFRFVPLSLIAAADVFVQFIWGLGVSEGEVQFCDVYGLDDELIAMVPHPVLAVLFLYPFTSLDEENKEESRVSATSTAGGKDAAKVIKARIAENPNSMNFNVMALSKK